ncbi:galanin receptor type 2 [Cavia porcellus]|uniref:galanin receptor type 2 n=1 Tax=Cavia porcellus TaxID=10141 RepID=UPI000C87668A|nr:galanin receptor type 2 [Cavia porcellus]
MDLCTFLFSYLLPVLFLGLTYARPLRYLWRTGDPVAVGSGARRTKGKVVRLLPAHSCCLIASYCLVSYANSYGNPTIYVLVSKHFRRICVCLLDGTPHYASGRMCVAAPAPGTHNGSG